MVYIKGAFKLQNCVQRIIRLTELKKPASFELLTEKYVAWNGSDHKQYISILLISYQKFVLIPGDKQIASDLDMS